MYPVRLHLVDFMVLSSSESENWSDHSDQIVLGNSERLIVTEDRRLVLWSSQLLLVSTLK